jgi:hypothetical protein
MLPTSQLLRYPQLSEFLSIHADFNIHQATFLPGPHNELWTLFEGPLPYQN